MRASLLVVAMLVAVIVAGLFACQPLGNGTGGESAGLEAGVSDAALRADATVAGGGCGTEQQSGSELCVATSLCPDVVVDTQTLPNCGFRIRGTAVDLVCACGTAICPMGIFATCAEAAALLANQTPQGVCVQVAEGRCSESAAGTSSSSSSSSSSSGSSSSPCDRRCLTECGGGAACASVCNC